MDIEQKIDEYFKKELMKEVNEMDVALDLALKDLQAQEVKDDVQLTEEQIEQLDEALISVPLIISIILGAPSIIKAIAKSLGFIYKKLKKLFGGKEESKVAEKILGFLDKWHHLYIKTLRQILRAGGVFKAAGIKDKQKQEKATEVVFYTIILGFAIHGGIATAKSIASIVQHASLAHAKAASIESVLTAVKSNEVKNFIMQIRA